MHPRTRKMCEQFGICLNGNPNLKILEPIGYNDSLNLTENARLVITDSGGLQEESTYFRTPCLTLRPNTERPITITHGSNRLTALPKLRSDIAQSLQGEERGGTMPPLWDGHASKRALEQILSAVAF
jgi:UDP-N-acetylglucosamine 2-epimerase (non-hydrolysing)